MSDKTGNDAGEAIATLLGKLIAIPTDYSPGETTEMMAYLKPLLEGWGYRVEVHTRVPGLENLVARLGSGRPSLVFNAHVDTVGAGDESLWRHPPFQATRRGDLIHGLGAANCKGSAAVQLWLAEEIARHGGPGRGEAVFTFVTSEENLGPDGMCYLREIGAIKPDMLLLGAPTDNALITAERGVLWARIVTTGTPAHAGQPDLGDNAILRMMRVLAHLEEVLAPRLRERRHGLLRSTMNLGKLAGGDNTNVVPSRCLAEIDRRLLPEETVDAAYAELRDLVHSAGEPKGTTSIEKLRGTNGFQGPDDGPLVTSLSAAVAAQTGKPATYTEAIGVSDGRYFAADGIEIINFGPGIGSEGHAPNESVSLSALTDSARILADTFGRLLGTADES